MANEIYITAEQNDSSGSHPEDARVTLADKPEGGVSIVLYSKIPFDPANLDPEQHKLLERLDKCVRENMQAVDSGYIPDAEIGPLRYGDGFNVGPTQLAPQADPDKPAPEFRKNDIDLPGFGSVSFIQINYRDPTKTEITPLPVTIQGLACYEGDREIARVEQDEWHPDTWYCEGFDKTERDEGEYLTKGEAMQEMKSRADKHREYLQQQARRQSEINHEAQDNMDFERQNSQRRSIPHTIGQMEARRSAFMQGRKRKREEAQTETIQYALLKTNAMGSNISILAEGPKKAINLDVDTTHAERVFEIPKEKQAKKAGGVGR